MKSDKGKVFKASDKLTTLPRYDPNGMSEPPMVYCTVANIIRINLFNEKKKVMEFNSFTKIIDLKANLTYEDIGISLP